MTSFKVHQEIVGQTTTTDAATHNITALAFVLPNDSSCSFKIRFQIRCSDGSSAYVVYEGLGKNKSGLVSQVGSTSAYSGVKSDTSPTDLSTVGGASMHFDTGAVSAYPQVAGIAGKTLVWTFWIDWWVA